MRLKVELCKRALRSGSPGIAPNFPRSERARGASWVLIVGWVLCSAGCAGYRLGPTNGESSGNRTVQVRPFQNQTLEPRLIDAITSSLRKQLQRDGTYRLATGSDGGDIVVEGTLVNFRRQHLSFQAADVLTPLDYRVILTAQVIARERNSGRVLLDRQLTGQSTVRAGSDLASAERQALPLLADDLARNVTALLVDGTW